MKDDVSYQLSHTDNKSLLSHSSYMEDIEPEIRDLLNKNNYVTPRKRQRLTSYDHSIPGVTSNIKENEDNTNEKVRKCYLS